MGTLTATNGFVFELDESDLDTVVMQGQKVRDLKWIYKRTRYGISLRAHYGATSCSLLNALYEINLQNHEVKFRDGNEKNWRGDNICAYIRDSNTKLPKISGVNTPWCTYGGKMIIKSLIGHRGHVCRKTCGRDTPELYEKCLNEAARRLWQGWEIVTGGRDDTDRSSTT
jgi:hypothetical protein